MTARASLRLPLPVRLALRDLKGGFAGFRIFIACIILGVATVTGVGSIARSLLDSLAREGQRILGGDVSFTTTGREFTAEERRWFAARGTLSEIATMRAMARREDGSAVLVEIKAVGTDYPTIGQAQIEPEYRNVQSALTEEKQGFGVVGDDTMQARFNLSPGEILLIGDAKFVWRGKLKSEPDRLAGGMGLGPRVMMSIPALRASGLIQPGSLVRWTYRVVLPPKKTPTGDTAAGTADVDAFVKSVEQAFPDGGWRVVNRDQISPNFSRNLQRFAQFLTLVGLTALVIGGIGMANAVRGFINRKRNDFAILKALGATGSYVFMAAMTEVILAALFGILLGLILGASLPFVLTAAFGTVIPVPFVPSIHPAELLLGFCFGLLAVVAFSLAPLGHVHDTSVSSLFREGVEVSKNRLRRKYKIMIGATVALFLATVIMTARDTRSALIYLLVIPTILLALQVIGFWLTVAARKVPRIGAAEWRLAIANLGRPGSLTRPVVASVGLGLSLFVALSTIDVNIRQPLTQGIPGQTPSFFFTDIQAAQGERFSGFVKARMPEATVDMVPMLRGRLARVNDAEAKTIRARENVAWVLEGDRGITFASELPAGSKLVRGEWWPKDYAGDPLVSVEAEVAEGLGLRLGDTVTLNVLGRNVTARVANMREVNWRSFGINFVFVFTPSTFQGAPYTWLATSTFPDAMEPVREAALVAAITKEFPAVSTVRLKETLDAIAGVARQLGIAIRSATVIALLASILVLAGALAAGQNARVYDLVILKVLGATRIRILKSLALEFVILGLVTAIFAVIAGTATAWLILSRVLAIDTFGFDGIGAAQTVFVALLVITALGLAGTWRSLGLKPAEALRQV